MGLIHQILKRTETKQINPVIVVDENRIVSRSDKQCYATILALEKKFKSKTPLTKKEQAGFRAAVNTLERRGSVKKVTEIEV